MSQRTNFGKIHEVAEPPNLIEIQLRSYEEFLQQNISPSKRKNVGLQAVFREVFPITSYDEKMTLDFVLYEIGEPKLNSLEAIREAETYSAPLYVTYELKDEAGAKQERVYMGEIPLMTVRGTFVINGAERVVVSQLHRSPGICFEQTQHLNGRWLHGFRIIPDRGTWLEVQFDNNDLLYVYLDRRRRRRKFLITTLLRSIGFSNDLDILNLFYTIQELKVSKALDLQKWSVTFWLIKRYIANHEAHYSVLRVNTDAKLQKRLKGYVIDQLQGREFHLTEYDFNNADGDDTLFTITADATDFPKVEEAINAGFDNAIAKDYQELLNSWSYVVQLEHGSDRLSVYQRSRFRLHAVAHTDDRPCAVVSDLLQARHVWHAVEGQLDHVAGGCGDVLANRVTGFKRPQQPTLRVVVTRAEAGY